ncbi:Uncharacterized protein FKW44_013089 [Caligus rogercresseyi]|uniref:Uncharacterized protein n=1 Tax=Caligus rogercresseyi TaxID=217165 RepID=A0A7T8HKF2_CALRO|nr:Uncharacterized protein FKW44_013089 [Caligus rogercresseyi]
MKKANILIRFDGTKGKDVSAWLEQVEFAKERFDIDNMAKVIPFFMDREAFEVFKQLAPSGGKNHGRVNKSICCMQVDGIRGILRKEMKDGRDRRSFPHGP